MTNLQSVFELDAQLEAEKLMTENKQPELKKPRTVLTFYTGHKGSEVVLESRVIDIIDQSNDVDEILVHVKMPAKDTNEFRQALTSQREALIKEFEKVIGIDEVLDFNDLRGKQERNQLRAIQRQALTKLREEL